MDDVASVMCLPPSWRNHWTPTRPLPSTSRAPQGPQSHTIGDAVGVLVGVGSGSQRRVVRTCGVSAFGPCPKPAETLILLGFRKCGGSDRTRTGGLWRDRREVDARDLSPFRQFTHSYTSQKPADARGQSEWRTPDNGSYRAFELVPPHDQGAAGDGSDDGLPGVVKAQAGAVLPKRKITMPMALPKSKKISW